MAEFLDSPQAVFDALPRHFRPEAVGNLQAVIQFDLSGDGGGQWYITIADRRLTVSSGRASAPNLSLSLAVQDYLAIINGELNPMHALMQGKVRFQGDLGLLMKIKAALPME